jgi:hypothetical protein
MSYRSKGKAHTKYSLCSSKFGVRSGANDPTTEKFTATNSWRKPRPTQGCSTSKEVYTHIYAIKLLLYVELR